MTFTKAQVIEMLKQAYESGWSSSHPQHQYSEDSAKDCAESIIGAYKNDNHSLPSS